MRRDMSPSRLAIREMKKSLKARRLELISEKFSVYPAIIIGNFLLFLVKMTMINEITIIVVDGTSIVDVYIIYIKSFTIY